MTLSEAIEFFLQYARIQGRSPKTISLYKWVFQEAQKSLGDPCLQRIHKIELRSFISSLFEKGWKNTSISIVHRVLNAFFNWAAREGMLCENPLKGIPAPKTDKVFPFMLDDGQIAELLKASRHGVRTGLRNHLFFLLFLDCGLRLNELIGLRLENVSLAQRSLKVYGKGSKERIVFVGSQTAKTLRRFLEQRGIKPGVSDHVFLDRKGEPLKPRWVQEIVARTGARAKCPQRVSPHKLRHVAATLAVRNGMDPFSLQRLFGWENLDTAMRYVNAASPALREAHAKASPVDKLMI